MPVTVKQLRPGDKVVLGDQSAVFIASEPHPIHAPLRLVIWELDNGEWSLDALSPDQEVGELVPGQNGPVRWSRIRRAFGVE